MPLKPILIFISRQVDRNLDNEVPVQFEIIHRAGDIEVSAYSSHWSSFSNSHGSDFTTSFPCQPCMHGCPEITDQRIKITVNLYRKLIIYGISRP